MEQSKHEEHEIHKQMAEQVQNEFKYDTDCIKIHVFNDFVQFDILPFEEGVEKHIRWHHIYTLDFNDKIFEDKLKVYRDLVHEHIRNSRLSNTVEKTRSKRKAYFR